VTSEDLLAARKTLGFRWGYGRGLHASEMGRALGLSGRDPGRLVRLYERDINQMPRHVVMTVKLYLEGAYPPESLGIKVFRREPSP
jgi:hypothetical protein